MSRGKRGKGNSRIRAATTRIPSHDDIHQALGPFLDETVPSSSFDRHTAIVCAAAVEHSLRRAIIAHLKPTIDDTELASLMDNDSSPLASMSAKTKLACALDIIGRDDKDAIDRIRIIRNAFAHSAVHISFLDFVSECDGLIPPGELWKREKEQYVTPRSRYALACIIYVLQLRRYRLWHDLKSSSS